MIKITLCFSPQIRPVFGNDGSHNFVLVTRRLGDDISAGITANAQNNEVRFSRYSGVQQDRQSLFWSLPPRFRGSQVRKRNENDIYVTSVIAALSKTRLLKC